MKIVEQRQKKTHRIRNLFGVALIMTVVLSLFGTVLYQSIKGVLAEQLGVTARSAAGAAAQAVMEDLESYKAQMVSGSADTEYYRKMQDYMWRSIEGSGVRYLFTEVKIDPETVSYILGSEPADGALFIPPGTTAFNDSYRAQAYATRKSYSSELLVDSQGDQWVVAYAPIFDADGSVLGLAGAEVETDALLISVYDQFGVVVFACIAIFSVLITFVLQVAPHFAAAAVRDELTGAYNKRYMMRFLSSQTGKARRTGTALSIIMVEVDQLDGIRGKFGRDFGDLVLRYFSMRVMNTLRQNDRYARLEDGLFLIALPDTSVGMAARVGERIRRIAENNKIHHLSAGHSVIATISAGAAGLTLSTVSVEALLQDAQSALAAAKGRRNAVASLQQGMITISDPPADR